MSTRLENPQSTSPFDVIIQNGLWFDGTGAAPAMRHIGIRDGKVIAVSAAALPTAGCPEVIDARDRWVMPGGEALTQNLSKCPCK